MQLREIDGVLVSFDSPKTFTRALLRFSEFTTKKQFRRFFTLEEYARLQGIELFRKYHIAHAIMVLDYYIADMSAVFGDSLYREEAELIEGLRSEGLYDSGKPFFVIGLHPEVVSSDEKAAILEHELSHVLFRTNEDYRELAHDLYAGLEPILKECVRYNLLDRHGYSEEEIINEFQAFFFYGWDDIVRPMFGAGDRLRATFNRLTAVPKSRVVPA